jgi:hypothetical protein
MNPSFGEESRCNVFKMSCRILRFFDKSISSMLPTEEDATKEENFFQEPEDDDRG